MAHCSLFEVHYDAIKSTTKETFTARDECMVGANTVAEAYDKFNKQFPSKRGTSFEITAIIKSHATLIQ